MSESAKVPTLGVVTVTYNSSSVLHDFLESVSMQTGVQVVLYAVDNASSDDSVSILSSATLSNGTIEVLASKTNLGVAEGNNVGLRRALDDGVDWVILLNNDTSFVKDTFSTLIEVAVRNRVKILSPVIEAEDPTGSLWFGGGSIVEWQGYRVLHSGIGTVAADRETVGEVERTGYAPTCALLVDPRVFAVVGLMDASYFVYWDDVDFALRCQRAGYDYFITSRARLLHKVSALTGGSDSWFSSRWDARNRALGIRRFARNSRELWLGYWFTRLLLLIRGFRRHESWRLLWMRQRAFSEGWRLDPTDHSVPG